MDHSYVVRYVGLKAPSIEVRAAGKKLAELVNKVCRTYKIVGSLGSPIKYELFYDGSGEPMSLYVFYIAFTPEAASVISNDFSYELEPENYEVDEP